MSQPTGAVAGDGKFLQDIHDVQSQAYDVIQKMVLARDASHNAQIDTLQQRATDLATERDMLVGKLDTLNKTITDLEENRIKPLEAEKEASSHAWTKISLELKRAQSELHDAQSDLTQSFTLGMANLRREHTEATQKLTNELEQSTLRMANLRQEHTETTQKLAHELEKSTLGMADLRREHTEATQKLANELEQTKLNSSRLAEQLRTAQARLVVATTLEEPGVKEIAPNVAAEEEMARLRKRNEELEKQLQSEKQRRAIRKESPPPEIVAVVMNPRKRQRTSSAVTPTNVDMKPKLESMARPENTIRPIKTAPTVPASTNPEAARGTSGTSSTSQPSQKSQQPQGPQVAQLSQQSRQTPPRPVLPSRTAAPRAISVDSDSDGPQRRQPSRRARNNKSFAGQDAETSSGDKHAEDGDDDWTESEEEDDQPTSSGPRPPRVSRRLPKGHPDPDTMLGTPGMGKSYKRFRLRGIDAHPMRCITRCTLPENSLGVSQIACCQYRHNILAPVMPGTDGIIFVGLGDEAFIGTKEDRNTVFELFVCFARSLWTYMGRYNFERIEPLSLEDWNNKFNESDRSAYASMHASRKDSFTTTFNEKETIPGVRHAYDTGELRVPQVYCRYLGFHPDMQTALDAIPEPKKKL